MNKLSEYVSTKALKAKREVKVVFITPFRNNSKN
jgi:hypothetical protein